MLLPPPPPNLQDSKRHCYETWLLCSLSTKKTPLIWRKIVPGRRITLPAQSNLSRVRVTKTLSRITELTAVRLGFEFAQTFAFLQAFDNRLHAPKEPTRLLFRVGAILFLIDNARACSVNLYLVVLTQEGEQKCLHGKKLSRIEG